MFNCYIATLSVVFFLLPIFISRSTLTYRALYYGKIETQTSYIYIYIYIHIGSLCLYIYIYLSIGIYIGSLTLQGIIYIYIYIYIYNVHALCRYVQVIAQDPMSCSVLS